MRNLPLDRSTTLNRTGRGHRARPGRPAAPPRAGRRLPAAELLAALVVALGGNAAAGCAGEAGETTGLADSAYVEVLAELVQIHQRVQTTRDTVGLTRWADSARRAVLAAHGVTQDELLAYARQKGGEPAHMRIIWERIATRVDSLEKSGEREGGEPRFRSSGQPGGGASSEDEGP